MSFEGGGSKGKDEKGPDISRRAALGLLAGGAATIFGVPKSGASEVQKSPETQRVHSVEEVVNHAIEKAVEAANKIPKENKFLDVNDLMKKILVKFRFKEAVESGSVEEVCKQGELILGKLKQIAEFAAADEAEIQAGKEIAKAADEALQEVKIISDRQTKYLKALDEILGGEVE